MTSGNHNENTSIDGRTRRRVVNPTAALLCAIFAITLLVGLRYLHGRQFRRTTDFLHDSAMHALLERNYGDAHLLLAQYLSVRPADVDAQAEMSRLLTDHLGTPLALRQAFRINEDLLRSATLQPEARLRHVRLAIRLKQFSAAAAHLKSMRAANPDSSEVFYFSGVASDAMRHPDAASEFLERAVALPNPVPEAFPLLARLRRDQPGGTDDTASLMQQMVEACPGSTARKIRAAWLIQQQRIDEALDDIWRSLPQSKADLQLNAMLVRCLSGLWQLPGHSADPSVTASAVTKGLRHFEELVREQPQQPQWRTHLATVLWLSGRSGDAITALEQGLKLFPGDGELRRTLIECCLNQQDLKSARRLLQQSSIAGLSRPVQDFLEGRARMLEQRWGEALKSLDRSMVTAGDDASLRLNAQMCLAVCRQQLGDRLGALNAYRDVSMASGGAEAARLGLAAAYWQAEQKDLALATWKQLVHVPGVAANLVALLIQHQLTLEVNARNWKEAESLLSVRPPLIDDPVQRAMLSADLHFAKGQLAEGLLVLETEKRRSPQRVELIRAMRHLRGAESTDLLRRLEQAAMQKPSSIETHAAIIRLHLAQDDENQAIAWAHQIVSGVGRLPSESAATYGLAADSLRLAAFQEQQFECCRNVGLLNNLALDCAKQSADRDFTQYPKYITLLAETNRHRDAATLLRHQTGLPSFVQAACWKELTRYSAAGSDQVATSANEVVAMIHREPHDLRLRMSYAEILLYASRLDEALAVCREVAAHDPGHLMARARIAWIETVRGNCRAETLQSAMAAFTAEPDNQALCVIAARVALERGRFQQSRDLAATVNSSAARTIESASLLKMNQVDEARLVAEMAEILAAGDPLFPADAALLKTVRHDLNQRQPALTELER